MAKTKTPKSDTKLVSGSDLKE